MEIAKTISILSLVLIFLLQACSSPDPTESEIVGTWESNTQAVINFNKDGTFESKKMPAGLLWLPEYSGQSLNGHGTWKIQKDQGSWQVYLGFDETNITGLKSGFGTRLYISGTGFLEKNPPWSLFLWKEEEGGERYEFEKQ